MYSSSWLPARDRVRSDFKKNGFRSFPVSLLSLKSLRKVTGQKIQIAYFTSKAICNEPYHEESESREQEDHRELSPIHHPFCTIHWMVNRTKFPVDDAWPPQQLSRHRDAVQAYRICRRVKYSRSLRISPLNALPCRSLTGDGA